MLSAATQRVLKFWEGEALTSCVVARATLRTARAASPRAPLGRATWVPGTPRRSDRSRDAPRRQSGVQDQGLVLRRCDWTMGLKAHRQPLRRKPEFFAAVASATSANSRLPARVDTGFHRSFDDNMR